MRKQIKAFMHSLDICQCHKTEQSASAGSVPRLLSYIPVTIREEAVEKELLRRDKVLKIVHECIQRAQFQNIGKDWIGQECEVLEDLLDLNQEEELITTPQALLGQRIRKGKKEVLVHWKGLSPTEATWEVRELIQERYPNFILEDKDGTLLNRGVKAILGFKGGEKEWKRVDNDERSDMKRGSLEMVAHAASGPRFLCRGYLYSGKRDR
ncbi:hypothetical protein WN944_003792 [Citrus x changshan-huyou]|uniref:Chromo domain-containing protein n=1 Tax=Citrus x changshan-huyou TaxID=2935761 RepID=A0AAP0QH84_9ROSI